MAQLPVDIIGASGLTEAETRNSVEMAIVKVLTPVLKASVIAKYGDELDITVYPYASGEQLKIDVNNFSSDVKRLIQRQIEFEINRRKTLNEADCLKDLRGKTAIGEISRVAEDGALFVALEIPDYYRRMILNGICPLRYQPSHERNHFRTGDVKEFYITSVVPVVSRRRAAKVRIMLSRSSCELPALLLQERSKISGIQCLKRLPGSFSSLISPMRISKDDIQCVSKELNEYLFVTVSNNG